MGIYKTETNTGSQESGHAAIEVTHAMSSIVLHQRTSLHYTMHKVCPTFTRWHIASFENLPWEIL